MILGHPQSEGQSRRMGGGVVGDDGSEIQEMLIGSPFHDSFAGAHKRIWKWAWFPNSTCKYNNKMYAQLPA